MGSLASNSVDLSVPEAGHPPFEIGTFAEQVSQLEGAWAEALRLQERLDIYRQYAGSPEDREALPIDASKGLKRLQSFKRQKPFDRPADWQRWLDRERTTEQELVDVMGLDSAWLETNAARLPWLDVLMSAYGQAEPSSFEPFDWPEHADLERCPFLPLLDPLFRRSFDALVADAQAVKARFPNAPFDPRRAATALTSPIPDLVASMLHRPMVVELHIARMEERLEGNDSKERFQNFIESLKDPITAVAVLKRYPVLARQLVLRFEQWRRAAGEFLERLAEDADILSRRCFSATSIGQLEVVTGAVSDPHRGGRGVYLLGFDSGFRIVYKPKSMAVETAFQGLQQWINERGFELGFRILEVVDRGDYGWMEMVDGAACDDHAQLSRFYRRQGAYLALLYVLEATDFHQENLIAAGEHPVPVDLETLLQPWVLGSKLGDFDDQPGAVLRSSLLRSNLLPDKWWGDGENQGVDLSGLASREGQMTPLPVLATAAVGTDEMRVERRKVEIPVGENRPRVAGAEVSLLDHRQDLEQGFRALYGLLTAHREELLADDGPLKAFEDAEVRILFRQTATYGTLLLESYHPHVLTHDPSRRRLFDRLWVMGEHRPFLKTLVGVEVRDLEQGDIPLFVTTGGSRDVWTWDGTTFPELLGQSGLESVRRRIEDLGPADLARQLAVLHDSLDALLLGTQAQPRPSFEMSPRERPAGRDELCAAAAEISRRIVDRAFRGSKEACWLTLHHGEVEGWHLAPTGPDVFQGLPGIAFSLGFLGDLLGDGELTELSRLALEAQRRQIRDDPSRVQGLGGFNGWGGVIYVLTQLGSLWGDEALLDEAMATTEGLAERIARDELLDWIAGSAGCAVSLLRLHEVRPDPSLLPLVRACGERLLEKAEPHGEGLGWRMPLAGDRALAGLSHGAAGIALALLHIADATGDETFRHTADRALAFERGLFVAERQNWPDLRAGAAEGMDASTGHFMQAWCHGAPGIGMARLAGLPFLDDDQIRAEIETTVRSTELNGLGQNHCLCHGDVGNLQLLAMAGRTLDRGDWSASAGRLAGGVLDSIRRDGLLFGLPGSVETPGLMTGLAGVAYGLARLAAPERIPSILTLESVPSKSS